MRQMGKSIEHIAESLGVSYYSVREATNHIVLARTLECSWCLKKFDWIPRRGRPPEYCCEMHKRYQRSVYESEKRPRRAA